MVQDDVLYIYVRILFKIIRLILDSEIKNEHLRFLDIGITEISEKEDRADKKIFDCYLT